MPDLATIDRILERACRAPSVHNTQPWSWRVYDTHVDLHADFTRQLVYADPQRRDLLISCGAALHHFEVAATAMGWATRIRRLPDVADEGLMASIELTSKEAPKDAREILDAIASRRTDRRQLTSWPVPLERLSALATVGGERGAVVLAVNEDSVKLRLQQLTARANELQRQDPGYLSEVDAWTTYWSSSGVPVGHVLRSAVLDRSNAMTRRFSHGVLDDPIVDAEPSSDGMLLVATSSDDAVSRVRAGEALSAIWLQATRENLCVLPLSQAVEVAETRRVLEDDLKGHAYAQVILRVGWFPGARRALTPTSRRDLNEVRVRCT